jgi:hypothetical protein
MSEITIRIDEETERTFWILYLDDCTAYPATAAGSLQMFIERRLKTWVDRAIHERTQQEEEQQQ